MQNILLVTIKGSQRSADVALPGDAHVGELLPLLREMCDGAGRAVDGAWSTPARRLYVARLGGALKADLSFFEGGVRSGDVLTFLEEFAQPDPGSDIHYGLSQDFVFGEFVSG